MEENTNLEQQTADQPDAFLDGWNEPEEGAAADQQPETSTEDSAETVTEPEKAADQQPKQETGGSGTEQPSETQNAQTDQTAPPAPVWRLKYMDREINLAQNDAQIPAMLQKSLDYDRVRAKYDEAKPVMELFGQFAKQANMSVADYVRFVRTEAKKAGGMDEAEAKRLVELEDREATVAAQEAARQEAARAAEARQESVRRDIETFRQTFPDVAARYATDMSAIPNTVWAEVNRGVPLTVAYTRFALEQAKATVQQEQKRAETAQKNNTNAARSTGSLQSAGNAAKNTDPFLEGWDSAG